MEPRSTGQARDESEMLRSTSRMSCSTMADHRMLDSCCVTNTNLRLAGSGTDGVHKDFASVTRPSTRVVSCPAESYRYHVKPRV
jgi:hypothetical protein